jgi:hypothetical protein
MTIATRPSFGRKPDLLAELAPPIGTSLEVRYRLPFLPRLLLGTLCLVLLIGFVELLANGFPSADLRSRGRVISLLQALPPEIRPYALGCLILLAGAVLVPALVRQTDTKPDFVIDSSGVADIGLLSRSSAGWSAISHIIITRRSYQLRDYFHLPFMQFILEPGATPRYDEVIPGIVSRKLLRRPRLSIPLGVADRTEDAILSAVRTHRPDIVVHHVG